jgi:hypothetical protein
VIPRALLRKYVDIYLINYITHAKKIPIQKLKREPLDGCLVICRNLIGRRLTNLLLLGIMKNFVEIY